jgi:hypothetical protein
MEMDDQTLNLFETLVKMAELLKSLIADNIKLSNLLREHYREGRPGMSAEEIDRAIWIGIARMDQDTERGKAENFPEK